MPLCVTCKVNPRPSANIAFCSKECRNVYASRYYERNATRIRRERREWRQSNSDQYQAARRRAALKRYGITPERFDAMRADQVDRCAVCLDTFEDTPHVHHDHETGSVLALLCHGCNTAEGLLKGDPARAMALARFMEANQEVRIYG